MCILAGDKTVERVTQRGYSMWLTLLGVALLFSLFLCYALRSSGTYYDDDLAHYQRAHWSWQHPALLLDTWGRPAFTILYAPVATFGFLPARLWSVCLASAVCLGAAVLARQRGVRWYWLAAVFTGVQPEFARQAFSTLTELTFAACLCATLIAYNARRWWLMAFIAAWLPLARYEALPLLLVFAVVLVQHRRPWLLLMLTLPLLVQNSFHAIEQHGLSRLLFPLDQLVGARANDLALDYGSGDMLYYLRQTPGAYGAVGAVLACYGLLRTRFGMLHMCVLLTLAVLSLSYWLLPTLGVAGYIRHLSTVAPVVGVLAAQGVEALGQRVRTRKRRSSVLLLLILVAVWAWSNGLIPSAVTAVVVALCTLSTPFSKRWQQCSAAGLAMIMVASGIGVVEPFAQSPEQATAIAAGSWLRQSPYRTHPVLGAHVWFEYGLEIDPFDSAQYRPITLANIARAAPGTIIVWDSHYASRLIWRTPFDVLQDPRVFRRLASWETPTLRLYIYEKIA